jgi:hypothetical protein
MRTTVLLCALLLLAGCKSSRRPFGNPDSPDSPIIISDNSSLDSKGFAQAATLLNFTKERHMRVYGPSLFAVKVDNYQPTWLEVVGSNSPATTTTCPSASSTANCLTGGAGTSWKIEIPTGGTSLTTLKWTYSDDPSEVYIQLSGNSPTIIDPSSTDVMVETPSSVNFTTATLKVTPATGSKQTATYSCSNSPCKMKIHYTCSTNCGN